ncbi:MAG: hypothetical protein M0Z53_12730 [Thermaerobacter sp.]|nr:hypothetical protein [Thermaerobacter sp.]
MGAMMMLRGFWFMPVVGIGLMGFFGWMITRLGWTPPSESEPPPTQDPVDILRERYAEGRISHQEFEETVAKLLETERELPHPSPSSPLPRAPGMKTGRKTRGGC